MSAATRRGSGVGEMEETRRIRELESHGKGRVRSRRVGNGGRMDG
jgi:hypothetical protein